MPQSDPPDCAKSARGHNLKVARPTQARRGRRPTPGRTEQQYESIDPMDKLSRSPTRLVPTAVSHPRPGILTLGCVGSLGCSRSPAGRLSVPRCPDRRDMSAISTIRTVQVNRLTAKTIAELARYMPRDTGITIAC